MNEVENNKFDWNEVVIVAKNAPEHLRPGEIASICGMEKVKFEDVAKEHQINVGDWIYTIEFGDGNSIELPERYLEPYEKNNNNLF